jgi:hypothetical protein
MQPNELDTFFKHIKYELKCSCNYCLNGFIKYKTCILYFDKIQLYYFNLFIPIEVQQLIINIVINYDIFIYGKLEYYYKLNDKINQFKTDLSILYNSPDLSKFYYHLFYKKFKEYYSIEYQNFFEKYVNLLKIIINHKRMTSFSIETFRYIYKYTQQIINDERFTRRMIYMYVDQLGTYNSEIFQILEKKLFTFNYAYKIEKDYKNKIIESILYYQKLIEF